MYQTNTEASWQDISDIVVQLQQEMLDALDECVQAEQRFKAASEDVERTRLTYEHKKQRWIEAGAVDNQKFWGSWPHSHSGNAPQTRGDAYRVAS